MTVLFDPRAYIFPKHPHWLPIQREGSDAGEGLSELLHLKQLF